MRRVPLTRPRVWLRHLPHHLPLDVRQLLDVTHKLLGNWSGPGYPLYCESALLNYIVYFAHAAPKASADEVYAAALWARSQDRARPWAPRPVPDVNLRRRFVYVARDGSRRHLFDGPRDILNHAAAELLRQRLDAPAQYVELALLEAIISAAVQHRSETAWEIWWRALETRGAREDLLLSMRRPGAFRR